MNAKLIVEGKEFDIQILDPELQKLIKPPKKTGYERVEGCGTYWYVDTIGEVEGGTDNDSNFNQHAYCTANYYSDETVAENNARADELMRQLRRFAVEHREKTLFLDNDSWCIEYDNMGDIDPRQTCFKYFGDIAFDSQETAKLAIETFRDELIWYFTEYKDSL